jgi:DNA-binding MarR family transcriptional regulator
MLPDTDQKAGDSALAKAPGPVSPDADQLLTMYSMPGHLIRRAKQKTTLTFAPIVKRFNLTPIQYAVLKTTSICPAVDQAELGEIVGLDTSTTGQVVARLEQRGLVTRKAEGRRQRVEATPAAMDLLKELGPLLAEIQEEITSPLTLKERQQLLRLLSKMLGIANHHHQPPQRGRRRVLPDSTGSGN